MKSNDLETCKPDYMRVLLTKDQADWLRNRGDTISYTARYLISCFDPDQIGRIARSGWRYARSGQLTESVSFRLTREQYALMRSFNRPFSDVLRAMIDFKMDQDLF